MSFRRWQPIEHALADHYAALGAFRDRHALHASPLWHDIGAEVTRVLGSVERGDADASLGPDARPDGRLRVVAWNVQRGARFDALCAALRTHPVLREADLLLLVEVDCGLGRSENRNVARDLALALDMSYAFAPSYLTIEDDWGENRERRPNTTALAGTAILSRWPIREAQNLDLPELRDKYSSSERRLGKKRALLVELAGPAGPWHVAACHLDSNASPSGRARQMTAVLDAIERAGRATPALIGGDFNSSTHDLSSTWASVRDALRTLFLRGLRRTIDGYLHPETTRERPLFEALAARGFIIDGFNDRTAPTYHYDFADPYAEQKLRRAGGAPLCWLTRRLLRPWRGRLPARLDWLAGRGVEPRGAIVIEPREGAAPSDHAAIACDVTPL